MALVELGPTFVKMGQILSTRPDLLPVEFIRELEKLQDHVPPFAPAETEEIIQSELGAPLKEIFKSFEETPLASASLGQVHRAQLADGEDVVVKIQRPRIRKTIEVDLEIALHLATLMEKHLEGGQSSAQPRSWKNSPIHSKTSSITVWKRPTWSILPCSLQVNPLFMFPRSIAKPQPGGFSPWNT